MEEEIVMIPESQYDELIDDVSYWSDAAFMLSKLLEENEISFNLNEEAVAEYRKSTQGVLQ